MMWRLVAIILAGAAIWAIWFGYDNLKVFRYFIFTLGQAKKKLSGE